MERTKKKARWSRSEKALLTLSLVVAVIAGTMTLWWQIANANPELAIPTPKLPQPNAYDTYVAAGRMLIHNDEIGEAVTKRGPGDPVITLREKQKLVQDNAETLRTLREGFAHPYHEPPARSFMHLFSHYAAFRGMARLLVLEGQVREARGDRGEAASSYLDAMYLGKEMPRGGPLIGALVGYACEAIGRRPLWKLADRLSASEARTAAQRMEEQIMTRRVPFADTLQEEKWTSQAGLIELFQQGSSNFASEMIAGGEQAPWRANLLFQARLLLKGKRRIIRDHARFMDQRIANARHPYAAHPPEPPLPNDPINEMILPVFGQAHIKAVDTETQDALLMVALALRAYRAERGRYPARLEELTPVYLKKIAADPFALQGTVKYRRTGDKYLLYSVGPDGRDDGGKPIHNLNGDGRQKNFAEAGTVGDFVVGVNLY